jgi:acetyl-CoA carboxylase biotin carboxyl carrier protein
MSLTYREVAEILKLVDASDCDELVLETENVRLIVRRRGSARVDELSGIAPSPDPSPTLARVRSGDADAGGSEYAEAEAVVSAQARSDGQFEVRAPMVGTFYLAPSPDAPPFVEVGDQVDRGTPICLIEVMKLFTTIESTVKGRVAEILAEDATLVEYGQALFVIEPTAEAH